MNGNGIPKHSAEEIERWLLQEFAKHLRVDAQSIDVETPIIRYGLESPDGVAITEALIRWTDLPIPITLFWDHPTIRDAARFVASVAHGELPADATPGRNGSVGGRGSREE